MKKLLIGAASLLFYISGQAQALEDFTFGVHLSPGMTLASVKDDLPLSSRVEYTDDGLTSIDENALQGFSFKLNVDYAFKENLFLSSGLQFSTKRLNIRNEDGSYIGTSVYHVSYLNIPIMLKYRTAEVKDKLRLNFAAGPTIDLKTRETHVGSDYAHFMNFAQNRSDIDAERGANGNNKPVDLFNGAALSFMLNAGAEYAVKEKISVYLGLSYQQGLTNMLSSKLIFNDTEQTKLKNTLAWRSSLLSLDLGVNFKI